MIPSLRFWSGRLLSLLALRLPRHTDMSLKTRCAYSTILTPYLLALASFRRHLRRALAPFASVESVGFVGFVAFGMRYLPMPP